MQPQTKPHASRRRGGTRRHGRLQSAYLLPPSSRQTRHAPPHLAIPARTFNDRQPATLMCRPAKLQKCINRWRRIAAKPGPCALVCRSRPALLGPRTAGKRRQKPADQPGDTVKRVVRSCICVPASTASELQRESTALSSLTSQRRPARPHAAPTASRGLREGRAPTARIALAPPAKPREAAPPEPSDAPRARPWGPRRTGP